MSYKFKKFIFLLLIIPLIYFGCSTSNEPIFSFGVVSDIQYADVESHDVRHYRESLKKLQECVDTLNTKKLTFVIQLGDFIEKNYASFDTVFSVFNKLNMPKYHALGNHDFSIRDRYKESINKKFGLEREYYDFKIDSWRFIVLDGHDISFHKRWEGSEIYSQSIKIHSELQHKNQQNAQKWNGAIGKAQLEWLKNKLNQANSQNEKVILFCHYPVFPREWHTLWNDEELLSLIDNFDCIVAYINGHNHAGNYAARNNKHYLTIKGMVDTPDENSFAVVDVYTDSLKVTGFGREPSRTLIIK